MDPKSMTEPPLISVCMPVYNAGQFLAEAIESVLNQTLGNFEFLIIDDGSTDGTPRILANYAARDPRIRLTSRPNRGLAPTLNELVDLARGEFIARMDGDDIALPERFQKQVDYLNGHPECVAVGCSVWYIDAEGDPIGDFPTPLEHEEIDAWHFKIGNGTAICHPSVMMRRDAVLAVGRYREFPVAEEVDLFLRLAERGRLKNLPEVLLRYRSHTSNFTHSRLDILYNYSYEMVKDACQRRNLTMQDQPEPKPRAPEPTASERREAFFWWSLQSGHLRTARKYAWHILRTAPFARESWRSVYCSIRGY